MPRSSHRSPTAPQAGPTACRAAHEQGFPRRRRRAMRQVSEEIAQNLTRRRLGAELLHEFKLRDDRQTFADGQFH